MALSADILVVDDDPDIREVLRVVLGKAGYRVRAARDAREAKQRLIEARPDLIILDVMMRADTEGFDLLHEMKGEEETKDIPVILLTSFLEKVRSRGPGAFEYIMDEPWAAAWIFEKPVQSEKLLREIEAILRDR